MLEWVREADTVYVLDFLRLARNTKDLLNVTEELEIKKVHLVSIKGNLDTSTTIGKLMLTMIAGINECVKREISKSEIIRKHGVSRPTVDGLIREKVLKN